MINSYLFYTIRQSISTIVFILIFFIIMKKFKYEYNPSSIFLKIINLILLLIIIKTKVWLYTPIVDIASIVISLAFICKCSYRMKFKTSFIYSFIYTMLYKISELTIHYILLYVYVFFMKEFKFNIGLKFEMIEFVIINLIIFILIYNFDKLKNLYINAKYYIYIMLTIAINVFIILFLNKATDSIYDFYSIISDNKINYNITFMPFVNFADFVFPYIIVGINIVFIGNLINSIKSTKEDAKIKVINEKLDMQHKYYLMQQESQKKIKNLYHDINNHIASIEALQNSNEDVNRYLDNIKNEMKDFDNIYNTGNILLDIILNEKSKICKNNNINFMCDINFLKCNFIDVVDVTSIFSNLLDNSIEACNKIDDDSQIKYINIRGTIIKKYYVIKCENSKINNIVIKNGTFITDKQDKYIHGIGIQSIKSSVEKYSGELNFKSDEVKFIATIYIPI